MELKEEKAQRVYEALKEGGKTVMEIRDATKMSGLDVISSLSALCHRLVTYNYTTKRYEINDVK